MATLSVEEAVIFARLMGTQEFVANADAMSASMDELGASSDVAGKEMETAGKRGAIMSQALYTMHRLFYLSTLAVVGLGVVTLKWGWDFNNAMQSAATALKPVQDGTFNVNQELTYLFNLTKHTPFQFADVTVAFRQMYLGMRTIGISAATVNQTIHAVVDALSATGKTSPGALNRVSTALQHMAYMGHITGQVVLQLARDGLPIYAALTKELGLTGDQIHNIGTLGIPAQKVLDALNKYIESTPGFENAALRQSHTLHGLFTTIKDDLSQLLGQLELGFFHRLQGEFVNITDWFDKFQMQIGKGASVKEIIGMSLGPGAATIWQQLADDLHLFWKEFGTVLTQLATSKPLWLTVYAALLLLHGVLLLIEPLTHLFGGAMWLLVPAFAAYVTISKIAAFWTGVNALEDTLMTARVKDLTFAQFLLKIGLIAYTGVLRGVAAATVLWEVATTGSLRGANGQFIALSGLQKLVRSMRIAILGYVAWVQAAAAATWEWTVALLANPYTWLALAIIALIAGLVILYMKWKPFRDIVNQTFTFIKDNAWAVAAALTIAFGPVGAALAGMLLIIKYWRQIQHLGTGALGGLGVHPATAAQQAAAPHRSFFGGLLHSIGKFPGSFGSGIPGMATGGHIMSSGFAYVGEAGPELLSLPRGATVTPLQGGMNGSPISMYIYPADITMDGQKVGNIVFKQYQLKQALA